MQYEDFARTPEADLLTRICLSVLQINGQLQGVGDRLGSDLGLPSSRFQVLGPISLSDTGLTVPQIARRMGLSRQTVHATVDRLAADGVVERVPNIDHQRSSLVRLTELGRERAGIAQERHAVWANRLAEGMDRSMLATTAEILEELTRRFEADEEQVGQE